MEKVAVYIDGCNFYFGLRSIRETYTDFKFDFEQYIKYIVGKRSLVHIRYYNASLKQGNNPDLFREQQKMFDRLRAIPNCTVQLCKRQKRDGADGAYYQVKGDDIHLAVDMLKDAYENKFDTAILVSGDGDFAPLVRYVKQAGKRVENYHFVKLISYDLLKECHISAIIDKKIANKFFLREQQMTLADTDMGRKIQEALDQKKK